MLVSWPGLRHAVVGTLMCLTLGVGGAAAQTPPDAAARWRAHNAEAVEAYRRGAYAEGAAAAERALALARDAFGPRHPDTLTSLNNLATLYDNQGRLGEAEPLYSEALRLSREVLGPRHPSTLGCLNNLAMLYLNQGRLSEAEPLFHDLRRLSREAFGSRHPNTLASMNNLAALYLHQGRYGEAEPLLSYGRNWVMAL